MKSFFVRWLVTTLAVGVAVKLTGMHCDGWAPLLVMALLLGVINAVVRPILLVLSIPVIVLSLGIAIPILNALLFWFASQLVPGFFVEGFWQAFFGSIIVSVASWALNAFLGTGEKSAFQVRTAHYSAYPNQHEPLGGNEEKVVHGRVVGE